MMHFESAHCGGVELVRVILKDVLLIHKKMGRKKILEEAYNVRREYRSMPLVWLKIILHCLLKIRIKHIQRDKNN